MTGSLSLVGLQLLLNCGVVELRELRLRAVWLRQWFSHLLSPPFPVAGSVRIPKTLGLSR